ncbi:MAG: STAS domain-containing protein [Flavobacteriia bacterium]|nr:STAS domain-containing protein [Flavobacteriia bacterium]
MHFELIHHAHFVVIKCLAEKLDINLASELKSEIILLNKKGINTIIFDLEKTKYCDSSGLSSILMGNRLCKDSGGKFVLCSINSVVKKLIEISQLDKVLFIQDSLESAIDFIQK